MAEKKMRRVGATRTGIGLIRKQREMGERENPAEAMVIEAAIALSFCIK